MAKQFTIKKSPPSHNKKDMATLFHETKTEAQAVQTVNDAEALVHKINELPFTHAQKMIIRAEVEQTLFNLGIAQLPNTFDALVEEALWWHNIAETSWLMVAIRLHKIQVNELYKEHGYSSFSAFQAEYSEWNSRNTKHMLAIVSTFLPTIEHDSHDSGVPGDTTANTTNLMLIQDYQRINAIGWTKMREIVSIVKEQPALKDKALQKAQQATRTELLQWVQEHKTKKTPTQHAPSKEHTTQNAQAHTSPLLATIIGDKGQELKGLFETAEKWHTFIKLMQEEGLLYEHDIETYNLL